MWSKREDKRKASRKEETYREVGICGHMFQNGLRQLGSAPFWVSIWSKVTVAEREVFCGWGLMNYLQPLSGYNERKSQQIRLPYKPNTHSQVNGTQTLLPYHLFHKLHKVPDCYPLTTTSHEKDYLRKMWQYSKQDSLKLTVSLIGTFNQFLDTGLFRVQAWSLWQRVHRL